MQETRVQSLGQEDSLEKGMATHSSVLARRIPWTEEPGGLESMGSQRVDNWETFIFSFQVWTWSKGSTAAGFLPSRGHWEMGWLPMNTGGWDDFPWTLRDGVLTPMKLHFKENSPKCLGAQSRSQSWQKAFYLVSKRMRARTRFKERRKYLKLQIFQRQCFKKDEGRKIFPLTFNREN